jgi:hypothetical protein
MDRIIISEHAVNNWEVVKDSTRALNGLHWRKPGAILKGWRPHTEPGTDGGYVVGIDKIDEFLSIGVGRGKEEG